MNGLTYFLLILIVAIIKVLLNADIPLVENTEIAVKLLLITNVSFLCLAIITYFRAIQFKNWKLYFIPYLISGIIPSILFFTDPYNFDINFLDYFNIFNTLFGLSLVLLLTFKNSNLNTKPL